MISVNINNQNTLDFGLGLLHYKIGKPTPKYNNIELLGVDGNLDLSPILGARRYERRASTFTFDIISNIYNFEQLRSLLLNLFNGKECNISLDSDPDYYYTGVIEIDFDYDDYLVGTVLMESNLYPYKFKNQKTILTLTSTTNTISNSYMCVTPTVYTTDNGMSLSINDSALYSLTPNTELMIPELFLNSGKNSCIVQGSGEIIIEFREGKL